MRPILEVAAEFAFASGRRSSVLATYSYKDLAKSAGLESEKAEFLGIVIPSLVLLQTRLQCLPSVPDRICQQYSGVIQTWCTSQRLSSPIRSESVHLPHSYAGTSNTCTHNCTSI